MNRDRTPIEEINTPVDVDVAAHPAEGQFRRLK
jgi:hypothetical protein